MRSVWVLRHANQVQYVEPQKDHTFLWPLSPEPFNFIYTHTHTFIHSSSCVLNFMLLAHTQKFTEVSRNT